MAAAHIEPKLTMWSKKFIDKINANMPQEVLQQSFVVKQLFFVWTAFVIALPRLLLQLKKRHLLRLPSVRLKVFRLRDEAPEIAEVRVPRLRRGKINPTCCWGVRVSLCGAGTFRPWIFWPGLLGHSAPAGLGDVQRQVRLANNYTTYTYKFVKAE